MRMRIGMLAAGLAVSAGMMLYGSEPLGKALKLYLDCDNTTLPCKDLRPIASQRTIRLAEGRFGQAYRLERTTRNRIDPKGWILDGAVKNSADGSILEFTGNGTAAQAFFDLPGGPNALSFRCSGNGKLIVKTRSAGQEKQVAEWTVSPQERSGLAVLDFNGSEGVAVLEASGQLKLNEIMLDAGIGYPVSYVAPGQQRPCDGLRLDHADRYFDLRQGSFICWLNAPWLQKETCGGATSFLNILSSPAVRKYNSDNIALGVWNSMPRTPGEKSYLAVMMKDETGRGGGGVTAPESELFDPAPWRHVVLNWQYADGKMTVELILDGGRKRFKNTAGYVPGPKPLYGHIGLVYDQVALNGLIDEIAVFSRTLTEDEIKTIYSSDKPLKELLEGK